MHKLRLSPNVLILDSYKPTKRPLWLRNYRVDLISAKEHEKRRFAEMALLLVPAVLLWELLGESWLSYLRAGSGSYPPEVLQAERSCSELHSLVHQRRGEEEVPLESPGIMRSSPVAPPLAVRCSRVAQGCRGRERRTFWAKANSAVVNVLAKGSAYLTSLSVGSTKLKLIYY